MPSDIKQAFTFKNIIITLSGLVIATAFAFFFFYYVPENSGNIALIYILALIVIVRYTDGYLLSVTRIKDQASAVKKTDESVEEVVSAAINRLKKRLPEASVNVSVPDDPLILPMDAILIEQVLLNLLENAIIHSQSRRPILCYVDHDQANVTFHVKDYGIGIDPERLKNIFDGNSYIGNRVSDSNKGMGIGLSICKTIITAHNGVISAGNHDQGAEFYFTLPKGD